MSEAWRILEILINTIYPKIKYSQNIRITSINAISVVQPVIGQLGLSRQRLDAAHRARQRGRAEFRTHIHPSAAITSRLSIPITEKMETPAELVDHNCLIYGDMTE